MIKVQSHIYETKLLIKLSYASINKIIHQNDLKRREI